MGGQRNRPSRRYDRRWRALGLGHKGDPSPLGPLDLAAARRRRDPAWDRACTALPGGSPKELEALAAKYRRGEL